MPTSLLLEIDDDSHPFSRAFFVWIAVVGLLWSAIIGCLLCCCCCCCCRRVPMGFVTHIHTFINSHPNHPLILFLRRWWSRRIQSRDNQQRIDAEARQNVEVVRERVHRERSESEIQAGPEAASAPSASSSSSSSPSPVPSASAPRVREDCSICLEKVTYPIDTNCSHTFCCLCVMQYHQQQGSGHSIRCPLCRRQCDVLMPSSLGWTHEETNSQRGRKLTADIHAYNARFSSAPRSWNAIAYDTPHYLRRLWTDLTSGGEASFRMLRQMRLWFIMIVSVLYLLAPFDLIPEGIFGLFGLLDDAIVLLGGLVMVAGVVRGIFVQN